MEERFESRILPLFARRTKEVGELLPELYLHGLAQGDFELALRGLLGNGGPLSPSSIARLRGQWEVDYQTWQERRLDDRELVYAWADGIYVRAGLEKDKACLLVVIGATSDGRKEPLDPTSTRGHWLRIEPRPKVSALCVGWATRQPDSHPASGGPAHTVQARRGTKTILNPSNEVQCIREWEG